LFNADLKKVAEWHRFRSPHEQQKFLKSLDTMYTQWNKQGAKYLGEGDAEECEGVMNKQGAKFEISGTTRRGGM
jgi:hypothetical protein